MPFRDRRRRRRPDLRRVVRRAGGRRASCGLPERACWSSIATRSASDRPPRAPPPRSGCATCRWGPRSGRRSIRCWSTPRPSSAPAGRCRGRSPRSTTGSCARCCGSRAGPPSSRPRRWRNASRRPRRPRHAAEGAAALPGARLRRHSRRRCRCPPIAATSAPRWSSTHSAGAGCSGPATTSSRPRRRSRAGWRCIPPARGEDLELWIDPRYVDAGYGWSFPARDELRIGVGSFDPHDPVKQPTLRLVEELAAEPHGYQGNWIPHRIRPATEDGVFFVGDSAGHCLPLTAEGIRTAFYFGIALGRELRAVLERRQDRAAALARYHAFSAGHRWKFEAMFAAQQSIRHLHGRPLDTLARACARPRVSEWAFRHYLDIAPPQFAIPAPPARAGRREASRGLTATGAVEPGRDAPRRSGRCARCSTGQRRRDRDAAEQRAHEHAGLAHALDEPRHGAGVGVRRTARRRRGSPARRAPRPTAACPASGASASCSGRSRSRPRRIRSSRS